MLIALLALRPASTTLIFVRHAETVANAMGKYNARTLNAFSVKGQAQIVALTAKLLPERTFDSILVSPSPRALKTITPYLARTHQVATVWPLLYECCTERPIQPAAPSFKYGAKITIPAGVDPKLFVIKPGQDRLPAPRNYGEGLAQVNETIKAFKSSFVGRRVLIVGHSAHGGLFLKGVTGKTVQIPNAVPLPFRISYLRDGGAIERKRP